MRIRPFGFVCGCVIAAVVGVPSLAVGGDGAHPAELPVGVLLTAGEVVRLDIDATPGDPISVEVPIEGWPYQLDLTPHSVRSPRYQLLVQGDDGALVPMLPSFPRTYRGTVAEVPGSRVAGSLLDTGLTVLVDLSALGLFWVEPLSHHIADAAADEYLVYPDGATICEGGCPTATPIDDPAMFPFPLYVPPSQAQAPGPEVAFGDGASNCGGANGLCIAELAVDCDREYFLDYGSVPAVEARVELVISTVNIQYETEVDVTHEISALIVRTVEPDPYSSTDPFTLLSQFRTEWITNQAGMPRDVAHLFTGKNLNGSVIGIAWTIGGICTDNGFCLSESDFSPSFPCVTDLTAHELGHLWGADHCTCPSNTMNAFITCANDFHDTFDIPEIVAHRNSRTCLEAQGGGGGIPCTDLVSFLTKCSNTGMLRARVTFTNGTHNGQTVTIRVDGVDHVVNIVNGRANFQMSGQGGTGSHTIELVDPPGCFAAQTPFCN